MGIWIVVLITLAMAGSVMWVMPSAREKQLTEMRQVALMAGVRVRLLDEKTAHKQYPWIENYRGYVNYELPLPAGKKWPFEKSRVVTVKQERLHELDRDTGLWPVLNETLAFDTLPDTVEAVTCYSHALAVLWREDGGKVSAEQVCNRLKEATKLEFD